jgi:hypothetical protein
MRAARSRLWVAQRRHPAGLHQRRQGVEDVVGGLGVEVAGRLVGKQDARRVDKSRWLA